MSAGGPADRAGLQPGDVIVEVDGEAATSVDALVVKTLTLHAGDIVRMTLERRGARHTTELRLADA